MRSDSNAEMSRKPNFKQILEQWRRQVEERLAKVRRRIIVISGKGGVGKSTISASIAILSALRGLKAGILDADLHGPSIPKLLGICERGLAAGPRGVEPATAPCGVKVVSLGLLLPSEETPVIWRGPLKTNAIRQLLSEVDWGELDLLVIDLPPGTGDEPLTIAQLLGRLDGSVIVTIPSDVSRIVVEKAVAFAFQVGVPILGIVENMSEAICPYCGRRFRLFPGEAAEAIASEHGLRVLAKVPLEPRLAEACDRGALADYLRQGQGAARELQKLVDELLRLLQLA